MRTQKYMKPFLPIVVSLIAMLMPLVGASDVLNQYNKRIRLQQMHAAEALSQALAHIPEERNKIAPSKGTLKKKSPAENPWKVANPWAQKKSEQKTVTVNQEIERPQAMNTPEYLFPHNIFLPRVVPPQTAALELEEPLHDSI